jgi:hypothetical protein
VLLAGEFVDVSADGVFRYPAELPDADGLDLPGFDQQVHVGATKGHGRELVSSD